MKKREIIQKIRTARYSHIQWVQRAKSLVNGFPINKDDIPITPDACSFGKWFYSDGQILLTLFNEKTVKELENKHNRLHDKYLSIFKIYFNPSAGFLSRLLKIHKKVSDKDRKKAMKYLLHLHELSDDMVKSLNIMETKINMADAEIFEKYT